MNASNLPAILSLLGVVLTLVVGILVEFVKSRSDSLRRIERLSELAPKMRSGSGERLMIESARDATAASWAVRTFAPKHRTYQVATLVLLALSLVILITSMTWLLGGGDTGSVIPSIVTGVALAAGGVSAYEVRFRLRANWMKAKRESAGVVRFQLDDALPLSPSTDSPAQVASENEPIP